MSHGPVRTDRRARTGIATLVMVGAVAAVSVSGCGSNRADKSAARAATAPDAVVIHDYDFGPTAVHVKAGATVTWTNADVSDHWVVSAPSSPEAFDLGRQRTGAAVTHVFAAPGTYPYFCNLHNYMKGTVVVS
jgi:plastocyanin